MKYLKMKIKDLIAKFWEINGEFIVKVLNSFERQAENGVRTKLLVARM